MSFESSYPTYESFLAMAKSFEAKYSQTEKCVILNKIHTEEKKKKKRYEYLYWYEKLAGETEKMVMFVETGGAEGGNCWGDKATEYQLNNSVKNIALDALLEKVIPNISMFAYRRLLNEHIESTTGHDQEYYGNYTDYAVSIVDLDKLYKKLIEIG